MHPRGQQGGGRDIESDVAQGEINAVAIANPDPVDFQTERHDPAEPLDRDGKVGIAQGLRDRSCEPSPASLGLQ